MALEDVLKENTASNTRLAEVMEKMIAAGGLGAAASAGATTKPKVTKPKNTVEQMKNAIMRVKDEISPAAASELICKLVGKPKSKLAELVNMPEKFDAAVADAEAALAAAAEAGTTEEDDSDGI